MKELLFKIIPFLFFCTSNLYAQRDNVASSNKWADKAAWQWTKKDYNNAIKNYKKSIQKYPDYYPAYHQLATLYQETGQFAEAGQIYHNGEKYLPILSDNYLLERAEVLWKSSNWTEALAQLNRCKNANHPKIQLLRQSLNWCIQQNSNPFSFPQNCGPQINSPYDEYFPSLRADDSAMIFTRKANGVEEDFFEVERDPCGGWQPSFPMASPPNSILHEGAHMISSDGRYIFFMRCGERTVNGWEKGGCDLYFSYIHNNKWQQPEAFGATINTPGYEGMPCLSTDQKSMYFVSDREGGYGGKDIWVSHFENGLWQVPVNLGAEINTPEDDLSPWIAADNETLYFASKGHPGYGGFDIYYSKKINDTLWAKPVNIGLGINTAHDDFAMSIGLQGNKGYFASNRNGGEGGMDIYEVDLPQKHAPNPYSLLFCKVYDSLDQRPLGYCQIYINAQNSKFDYQYQSNRGNGTILLSLPTNQEITISTKRDGYLDYQTVLHLDTSYTHPPDTMGIALLPQFYEPPVNESLLLRVHFTTNSLIVSDSILQVLPSLFTNNENAATAQFYINGFTDNTGTPVVNEYYSFERARIIARHLMELGIQESQIHIQGWADENPIAPNDTDYNRYMNRRVEVIMRN